MYVMCRSDTTFHSQVSGECTAKGNSSAQCFPVAVAMTRFPDPCKKKGSSYQVLHGFDGAVLNLTNPGPHLTGPKTLRSDSSANVIA